MPSETHIGTRLTALWFFSLTVCCASPAKAAERADFEQMWEAEYSLSVPTRANAGETVLAEVSDLAGELPTDVNVAWSVEPAWFAQLELVARNQSNSPAGALIHLPHRPDGLRGKIVARVSGARIAGRELQASIEIFPYASGWVVEALPTAIETLETANIGELDLDGSAFNLAYVPAGRSFGEGAGPLRL